MLLVTLGFHAHQAARSSRTVTPLTPTAVMAATLPLTKDTGPSMGRQHLASSTANFRALELELELELVQALELALLKSVYTVKESTLLLLLW